MSARSISAMPPATPCVRRAAPPRRSLPFSPMSATPSSSDTSFTASPATPPGSPPAPTAAKAHAVALSFASPSPAKKLKVETPMRAWTTARLKGYNDSVEAKIALFYTNHGCIVKGGEVTLHIDNTNPENVRFTTAQKGGTLIALGPQLGTGAHKIVRAISDKIVVKFYKEELLRDVDPALLRNQLMTKLTIHQYLLVKSAIDPRDPHIRVATFYNHETALKDGYQEWELIKGVSLAKAFGDIVPKIKSKEDLETSPYKGLLTVVQKFFTLAAELDTPLDLGLDNFIIDESGKVVLIDFMERPDHYNVDVVKRYNEGHPNSADGGPMLQVQVGLESCAMRNPHVFEYLIAGVKAQPKLGPAFRVLSEKHPDNSTFEVKPAWLRLLEAQGGGD